MTSTAERLNTALAERIAEYGSMLVAYSGGVDSTVLAVTAHQVLGDRMLAVLAVSDVYPAAEIVSARRIASTLRLPLIEFQTDELALPAFAENTADRCYHCKAELFGHLVAIADERGLAAVADGTNADDLADHRPGRRAAAELGVASPLADLGITKAEVRALARLLGLPNAEKPSMACLASRFPYGERIEADGLARVRLAEDAVRALGLEQFRVRAHGDVARLEVAPEELDTAWTVKTGLVDAVKSAGFAYVALDLEGYRSGAMNEVLPRAAESGPS